MHGQDKHFEQQKSFFNSRIVGNSRPLSTYMKVFQISRCDIKKLLEGKKLLLVGGGHSQIQRTLDFVKINCDVTNVDPYIKDSRSARTVINKDFIDTDFENEFDEVWALYSLPLYSPDIQHAVRFYRRAAVALKPGGTLRIGGHPKWVNGALLAPVHFIRDSMNFMVLDMKIEETFSLPYTLPPHHKFNINYTLLPESRHWEMWTAPTIPAIKRALNDHIKRLR